MNTIGFIFFIGFIIMSGLCNGMEEDFRNTFESLEQELKRREKNNE